MKVGELTSRYGGMRTPTIDSILICAALRHHYTAMVRGRCGNKRYVSVPTYDMTMVATQLRSVKLAKTFVEAQFAYLTPEFCTKAYKVPYPPANVVFGKGCWDRYDKFIRGV